MAAGDLTPGRRLPDGTQELYDLKPAEYARGIGGSVVWLCLPNGLHGAINTEKWTVTEEDDGSLTVSPSIDGHPMERFGRWHGFLERGVFREV